MAQTACPLKQMHCIVAYLRFHILLPAGNNLGHISRIHQVHKKNVFQSRVAAR